MTLDPDRIDDIVLGLLYLTLHDGDRAWKGFDWAVLQRLHDKGLIGNPVNRNKSVVLTEAGLISAERAAREHLCRPADGGWQRLRARPDTEFRSADGLRGVLCRDAVNRRHFLRVDTGDGEFVDYDIVHDDLPIVIDRGAMAALYCAPGGQFLDHEPRVMGLDDGTDDA